MRRPALAPRIALLLLPVALVAGCIPAPADIGVDYSGPIYRKPGAEAPRVVTDKPVLPVVAGTECAAVTEVPTRRRSECGVRQVMSRYNNGLQVLYQRRLADDPFLKGRVVLQMNILADGSVQAVDVASSDMNDAELAQQIAAYVRTITFGPLENVPPWSDTYTLEFAPPKAQPAGEPVQPAASAPATN